MIYRKATISDLEILWNHNITDHLGDTRWISWKNEFIENNRSNRAVTFVVINDDIFIGEGTLILSPDCNAIAGRKVLCDGKSIANINALRIQKQYEGQGHISILIHRMEDYAINHGISKLSIGVEAKETRNLAIYLHLGFTEFLFADQVDDTLVLYFCKQLKTKQ